MLPIFDLTGKVALVTGCKRGIGFAISEGLAAAGADIIGVSATLELQQSDIEKSVIALGRKFYAYQCDFKDRSALYDFIKKVKSAHMVVDILVNNAGVMDQFDPVADVDNHTWERVMAINVTGPFKAMRKAVQLMLPAGKGSIVNISSVGGLPLLSTNSKK